MTQLLVSDFRSAQSRFDPLTGFGNRERLIADLTVALEPENPPSILAVFDLGGSDDYRRIFGEPASDVLIVRLAEEFWRVMGQSSACYRARPDEFCTLVDLPIEPALTKLDAAAAALREVGESSLITTSYGVALLPYEAVEPLDAVMVADHDLDLARGNRERPAPRPRPWSQGIDLSRYISMNRTASSAFG